MRFFPHIQIFSRLYNLPPRQAFWSSRRPDSLAIILYRKQIRYQGGGTDRKSVIDREESGTKNKDGGSFGKRAVTVEYNFDEF